MTTEIEKRNQMAGSHITKSEKNYLRVYAAQHGHTTSTFIRYLLTDVLSKVEDENNPFFTAQNKQ